MRMETITQHSSGRAVGTPQALALQTPEFVHTEVYVAWSSVTICVMKASALVCMSYLNGGSNSWEGPTQQKQHFKT